METLQKNRGKVRLFHRLLRVASWIAAIPDRVTPPPFRLIQIGSAFWQSRALHAATALGIADALGDGEQSSADLAGMLNLHEDHLYRLLRMLAANGVFAEAPHRRFRNSKLSHHLRHDHPQTVRPLILMHNSPEMTRPWTEFLTDAVRTGATPFVEAHGEELYPYMDRHPAFDRLFAEAMDAVESVTGLDYLEDFRWERFERLIDLGGSLGSKAMAVLQRQPQLRAVVFDREQVVAGARAHWEGKVDASVLARAEFVGGDLFGPLPKAASAGDLYLLVAVLHGMGDEEARTLLGNLRGAMGDHPATLAVVETVAAECGIDPTVAAFDLQMLMGTRGRERTESEWRALFDAAGFRIREFVPVRTFARFIVAAPT